MSYILNYIKYIQKQKTQTSRVCVCVCENKPQKTLAEVNQKDC